MDHSTHTIRKVQLVHLSSARASYRPLCLPQYSAGGVCFSTAAVSVHSVFWPWCVRMGRFWLFGFRSSLIACTGRFCRSIFLFYAHMGRFRSLILCSTPIGGGSDTIYHVLRPHGEVPLLYFVFYACMGGSVALFLFYTCMGRFRCCILWFIAVWGGSAKFFIERSSPLYLFRLFS